MSSPNSNSSSKCGTLDAINSTSFDPDQYMHLLVHRSNLEGLLQRHVEMAAEIKNLDTDLQMLVYENYNKFISVTDTIKQMKSNIVGMEANMEQLLEKIMSVRSRSAGVNTRLFEKREHATFFVKFWHQLIRRISIDFFPSCWELPLPCSLLCLPSLSSYANIHVPLYSC
ncbi:vacuolar protein sorting-associated protein 51 homolog isoform X1 [Malus domestica]|uniref:vacuolar protein sorting-associated protein 51 homolog isoform X1 n=1 Tax=Malus domestica TaxID=3750 RepID=UPI00397529E0